MQTAIYPGSFDPITVGHLDVIRRAANMFERVIVCVVANANKKTLLILEERKEQAERVTAAFPNVEVDSWNGLLVDYAKQSDFEYEFMMALTNKKLNPGVETIFLATDEKYMYLSSSAVKEIAAFHGDVTEFLPPEILDDVLRKFQQEGS